MGVAPTTAASPSPQLLPVALCSCAAAGCSRGGGAVGAVAGVPSWTSYAGVSPASPTALQQGRAMDERRDNELRASRMLLEPTPGSKGGFFEWLHGKPPPPCTNGRHTWKAGALARPYVEQVLQRRHAHAGPPL